MAVFVDTNLLSDIIHADPQWEPWAEARVLEYFGELLINPIIYAELACRAASVKEMEQVLAPFELEYLDLPKEALFLAEQAFVQYRQRGGNKIAPFPTFSLAPMPPRSICQSLRGKLDAIEPTSPKSN